MPTIYDVVRKCNYSPGSDLKVLNKLKNSDIETYTDSSGDYMKDKKNLKRIGVLFYDESNNGLIHHFFSRVINGIVLTAEENDYDLIFLSKDVKRKNETYLEYCKDLELIGVIIICIDKLYPHLIELTKSDIKVALMDIEYGNLVSVTSDNDQGISDALEYLYSLGHREIGFIHGSSNSYITQLRINFYKKHCKRLKLNLHPDYLLASQYYNKNQSYKDVVNLIDGEKKIATAYLLADDYMALGVMKAFNDKGYNVPNDVSVIGFDNITLCELAVPRLTTISQDAFQLGKILASKLIAEIKGEKLSGDNNYKLQCELVIRDSCKKIY